MPSNSRDSRHWFFEGDGDERWICNNPLRQDQTRNALAGIVTEYQCLLSPQLSDADAVAKFLSIREQYGEAVRCSE